MTQQFSMLNPDGSVSDIVRARQQCHDGMAVALDHAGIEWSDVAWKFLCNYAARSNVSFTGEDVTRASVEWGMSQPPTTRAWGGLYRKAQNAGVIVWVDNDGKRANGSPCARYRKT